MKDYVELSPEIRKWNTYHFHGLGISKEET